MLGSNLDQRILYTVQRSTAFKALKNIENLFQFSHDTRSAFQQLNNASLGEVDNVLFLQILASEFRLLVVTESWRWMSLRPLILDTVNSCTKSEG